jgi:hypothetical protein
MLNFVFLNSWSIGTGPEFDNACHVLHENSIHAIEGAKCSTECETWWHSKHPVFSPAGRRLDMATDLKAMLKTCKIKYKGEQKSTAVWRREAACMKRGVGQVWRAVRDGLCLDFIDLIIYLYAKKTNDRLSDQQRSYHYEPSEKGISNQNVGRCGHLAFANSGARSRFI